MSDSGEGRRAVQAAMKQVLGERLTTVFARQGHCAFDPHITATYPPADITLERIGDLADVELPNLLRQRNASIPSKEPP